MGDKETREILFPKKPIGDLNSVPHYRCPTCKKTVVLYEDSPKHPYCQWCGQRLDWEETKGNCVQLGHGGKV